MNGRHTEETVERLTGLLEKTLEAGSSLKAHLMVIKGFVPFERDWPPGREGDAIAAYYEHVVGVPPYEKPEGVYAMRKARGVLMLRDALEGKPPAARYFTPGRQFPCGFDELAGRYEEWMRASGMSEITVDSRLGRLMPLAVFLDEKGAEGLRAMCASDLAEFVAGLSGRYSAAGVANIIGTLRSFFSCPGIGELLEFDPAALLAPVRVGPHERVASCFTPEEIGAALLAIDRSKPSGKLAFAVMALAATCGLRSLDIKRLRIDSIDWAGRTISLVQHKTSRQVDVPLPECTALALLDYVKNARPLVDDPHLFVRLRAPHVPYADAHHMANIPREAFRRAGIDVSGRRCGLHSLRHSLATSLVAGDAPINEVASVLGHASAQSTVPYVWSDAERLRKVAGEVRP